MIFTQRSFSNGDLVLFGLVSLEPKTTVGPRVYLSTRVIKILLEIITKMMQYMKDRVAFFKDICTLPRYLVAAESPCSDHVTPPANSLGVELKIVGQGDFTGIEKKKPTLILKLEWAMYLARGSNDAHN